MYVRQTTCEVSMAQKFTLPNYGKVQALTFIPARDDAIMIGYDYVFTEFEYLFWVKGVSINSSFEIYKVYIVTQMSLDSAMMANLSPIITSGLTEAATVTVDMLVFGQ